MNYLDILDEELLNNIFDIVANFIEKDIEQTKNKLYKVKNLVEGLIIDVDSDEYYEDSTYIILIIIIFLIVWISIYILNILLIIL